MVDLFLCLKIPLDLNNTKYRETWGINQRMCFSNLMNLIGIKKDKISPLSN